MADITRLKTALKSAHEAGDTQAAQKIASAIRSASASQKERSLSGRLKIGQPEEQKMGFLNKGIAMTLGAPVDLTNALLNVVGMGSDKPFGGSESIRSGMEKIGAPTPDRDPETTGEYIFSGMGEAAGAILPVSALARRYQGAQNAIGQMASGINREAVQKPISTGIAELTAGGAAGIGRDIAETNDLGPTGQALLELTAGLTPGGTVHAIRRGPVSMAARKTKDLGAKAFVPFTQAGAEVRAARRVQELSDDIPEALSGIKDLEGYGLSPAASTGQEGLLQLEDAVLRGDPARARNMSKRTEKAVDDLERSILSEGKEFIGKPKQLMDIRKKRALSALDARVETAADDAAASLADLGEVSPEDATMAVRDRLVAALNDAKVEESRLWSRIPEKTKVPVTKTMRAFKSLRESLPMASVNDMPESAKRVLGGRMGSQSMRVTKTNIKELDGLYKKLGEEATKARAEKNFNTARIAEDLREAILADIDNADGGPGVQETIKTARAFSRQLNEKFRKGSVGKILGFGREGGPKMAPELSMQQTIGRSGQAGELARREIAMATQYDPTALEGMQNYIKGMFMRNAVEDGFVNPSKAKTFIRSNKEILDAFPGLRRQLSVAKNAEDVRRRVTKKGDFFRTKIQKPEVGTASRVLNSTIGDEMDRIFSRSNDDPEATMKAVMRTLAKDKSGDAKRGFKAGATEWLFGKAMRGVSGQVSGAKLKAMIEDPAQAKVLRQIYSKPELDRISKVADIMERFRKQQGSNSPSIAILNDKPAWLLNVLAGTLGARFGSQVARGSGYGNIQIPGIFASSFRKLANRLTADKAVQMLSDAVEDPKLFQALLEYRPLSKNKQIIQRNKIYDKTLSAWMAGPGARLLEEEEVE